MDVSLLLSARAPPFPARAPPRESPCRRSSVAPRTRAPTAADPSAVASSRASTTAECSSTITASPARITGIAERQPLCADARRFGSRRSPRHPFADPVAPRRAPSVPGLRDRLASRISSHRSPVARIVDHPNDLAGSTLRSWPRATAEPAKPSTATPTRIIELATDPVHRCCRSSLPIARNLQPIAVQINASYC